MSKQRFEYAPDLTGDWKGELVNDALDALSESGFGPEDQPKLIVDIAVQENDDTITPGDYVKHEPHNGNGIIETEVESVEGDGTIHTVYRGQNREGTPITERYQLQQGDIVD